MGAASKNRTHFLNFLHYPKTAERLPESFAELQTMVLFTLSNLSNRKLRTELYETIS